MNRPTLNLIIDTIAAAGLLGMLATGYVLRFPLPPGTNRELALWGLSRHQWGDIHFWASAALITTLTIHVILHWQWIVTMVQKRVLGREATGGEHLRGGLVAAAITIAALAAFAITAHATVGPRTEPCCDEPPTRGNASAASKAPSGPEFWRDVYPMLKPQCLACHGPNEANGDFRIDRRGDYFGPKKRVIPGNAGKSPLVQLLRGERPDAPMPRVHRLEDADLKLLVRWVDSGARWERKP